MTCGLISAFKTKAFALVNLFTQAFTWESGEASLNLNLTGEVPQDQNFEDCSHVPLHWGRGQPGWSHH